MSKIAEFENDRSLASELRKFTDVCLVGGKFVPLPPPHPPTIQTSVKLRDFEELDTVFIRISAQPRISVHLE